MPRNRRSSRRPRPGVDDGAIGVATQPARRAPRKDRSVIDAGGPDDRDRIALSDAIALQRRGDPVHQRIERGVIDLTGSFGEGNLVAPFLRVRANEIGQGGKVGGKEVGRRSWSLDIGILMFDLLGDRGPECHTGYSKTRRTPYRGAAVCPNRIFFASSVMGFCSLTSAPLA